MHAPPPTPPGSRLVVHHVAPSGSCRGASLAGWILLAPLFGTAGGVEADLSPGLPHVSHARQYEIWFSAALP